MILPMLICSDDLSTTVTIEKTPNMILFCSNSPFGMICFDFSILVMLQLPVNRTENTFWPDRKRTGENG